ncbi:MAG: DUF3106 domain-containing protein [Variovorax sp.]
MSFTGAQAQLKPEAAPASVQAAKPSTSKPFWRDLTARQQRALDPLAPHWDSLSEPHKRKWLALSRNYAKLSPADQAMLHSRMTEWAGLSNQQRTQARFNFAEVNRVPADERKAKWEAYQALSKDEKRKLAASAAPRPPGAAAMVQPVPARKLAIPTLAPEGQYTPRIQLTPPPTTTSLRPQAETAAPVAAPSFPSPPAEAQVPQSVPAGPGEASPFLKPPVRVTDQPSSAP